MTASSCLSIEDGSPADYSPQQTSAAPWLNELVHIHGDESMHHTCAGHTGVCQTPMYVLDMDSQKSMHMSLDESMHRGACEHTDAYQKTMHVNMDSQKTMHINMDESMHHACGHTDIYHEKTLHVDMDVIDHHADCSPPPTLSSSDTSLTSPRSSFDPQQYPPDFVAFLQGSDPVKEELDRLQTEVREKNRELAEARAEIKALKIAERSRERALEELSDELARVDEKLERAEVLLDNKNLELKRMNEEKKAAQAAQHAAEAIVRRVQAAHMRDEEMPPIEAILAPLDAELKLTRQEVVRLQEDNRALDRLTKSKEAALLEAERTVDIAAAKASMVEDLQNKNQELVKHIEYYQEENKVLDKLHRQKITEVEKLSMRVAELEEVLLSCGPNEANAARDYQRQLQQLQEEKKALERELARAKITANRVAAVIAKGWKGSNDKVMPVKHWLEERRLLQSEMEQLREKLASMERAAKAESILKEKVQIRLKVLEESVMLRGPLSSSPQAGAVATSQTRRTAPITSPRNTVNSISSSTRSSTLQGATRISAYSTVRTSRAKVPDEQDSSRKEVGQCSSARELLLRNVRSVSKSFNILHFRDIEVETGSVKPDANATNCTNVNESTPPPTCCTDVKEVEVDSVSGQLYDLLQKEVVFLRKICEQRERGITEKDNAIEMLQKKVNSLNRSMEVESKKLRREVSSLEKELVTLRSSAARPVSIASKHKRNNLPAQVAN
eukprot:c22645_g1_i1 orf=546-2735(-)